MVTPKIAQIAPLLTLLACAGPNDETLLEELRVLAMIPEAPEIAPEEQTDLDVLVVDPLDTGAEVLVWSCTTLDGQICLEDIEGRSVEVMRPVEGHISTQVSASSSLGLIAGPEPLPLIQVWALACEEGLCPLIEQVRAGESIATELWANPLDWMSELPKQGVSLAATSLSVSTRSVEERHGAPTMDAVTSSDSTRPGGEIQIEATATGELGEEAKIWAYTEAGGFTATNTRPDEMGVAKLTWIAPETSETEVPVYLVLVDGLGGSALWEGVIASSGEEVM